MEEAVRRLSPSAYHSVASNLLDDWVVRYGQRRYKSWLYSGDNALDRMEVRIKRICG